MKKLFILIGFGLMPILLLSQIPQAFNYQATVRNSLGEIQFEVDADFRIEILQNDSTIYSENHLEKNTGKTGTVNFKIGMGIDKEGDFSQINWSQGQLQIRVHLKLPGGIEEEMGKSDIVAVPFALYAEHSGDWRNIGDTILHSDGKNIGINTENPQAELDVNGAIYVDNTIFFKPDESTSLNGDLRFSGLFNDGSNDYYRLFHLGGTNAEKSRRSLWMFGHSQRIMDVSIDGKMSIGGLKNGNDFLGALDVNGTIHVDNKVFFKPDESTSLDGDLRFTGLFNDGSNDYYRLYHLGGENGSRRNLWIFGHSQRRMDVSIDGKLNIGGLANGSDLDPDIVLNVVGMGSVKSLKITGGSDIKEDFDSIDDLEPGDVVVIDENNPGNIRRTNEEYDRKVAGIISGANGINPGISLSQDDVLEGEFPLTMLGRVYVKVTGKVEIGDMLTTSTQSGYAMSVTDYSKANGTVIGKAMTSLEGGEGMVLVLVNLQ